MDVYGFNVGIAGTCYVSMGLGFMVMAQAQGRLMDVVYRKLKARYGGEGKPEYRLPMSAPLTPMQHYSVSLTYSLATVLPGSICLPLGLLLYGWGAERHLHWIVPNIGLFFIAAGMIGELTALHISSC